MNQEARLKWAAIREGFKEGWQEEMRDGWRGLAYRFYIEPFVVLGQFAKRKFISLMRR